MSSVEQIGQRLGEIRGEVRRLYLQYGVAALALWIVAYFLGTFLLDFFIPKLPVGVRLFFLFAGLAGLGYGYWRYVLYPMRVRLVDDDIAGRLEAQYPKLRDRLISTVQLLRVSDPRAHSPEMVKALAMETVRATRELDFHSIVLPTLPLRMAVGAGLSVAGLLICALAWPHYTGIYLRRLFGSSVPWPRKTLLTVDCPSVVALGSDVTVVVTANKGGFPAKAYIRKRDATGAEEQKTMTRSTDKEEFHHKFEKVAEAFSFSVQGGDDETAWRDVRVLIPPRIERVQAYLAYPKYMGMKDTAPDKPEDGGNLRVPVGTRATLCVTTSVAVTWGRLLLGRQGQGAGQEEVKLALENDGTGVPRLLRGVVEVTHDTEYIIEVKGTNDLKNKDPVHYSIKAMVDNAPTVKVVEPGADKTVAPDAVMPIRVSVTDDYGIRSIALVHRLATGEKPPETTIKFDAAQNSAEYGARKIDSSFDFDLAAIKAKEGDVISYRIEAEDTNEQPRANVTRSRQYLFTVVSKTTLENQIDDRRMRIKEDLQKLIQYQEEERRNVLRLQQLLGTKENLERAERQSMAGASTSQRQVSQKLDRLSHELEEILRDVEHNKLWDVTSREKLGTMKDMLKTDAEGKSPEAANLLSQAASASKGPERLTRLSDAGDKQAQLVDDMKAVLAKMGEWEDYMEVVKIVRSLKERQVRLNKRIEESRDAQRK